MKKLQLEIQFKGLRPETWERLKTELPESLLQVVTVESGMIAQRVWIDTYFMVTIDKPVRNGRLGTMFLVWHSGSDRFLEEMKRTLEDDTPSYFEFQDMIQSKLFLLRLKPNPMVRFRLSEIIE